MSSTSATVATVGGERLAPREISNRSGIEIKPLAEQIGVTRAYLCKIEMGHSKNVSHDVYVAWVAALGITDRRRRCRARPAGTLWRLL